MSSTHLKKLTTVLIFAVFSALYGAEITLSSGKYQLKLNPNKACTIQSLSYNKWNFIPNRGSNGLIMAARQGKYLGCDYNEKLRSLVITVDGRRVANSGAHQGQKIAIVRRSVLQNVEVVTTWQLTPQGLEWRTMFQTDKQPQNIWSLYLYAVSFDPRTVSFLAQAANGSTLGAKFVNDGQWKLNSDVHFVALRDRVSQQGVMIYFPQVIKAGGRKATIWDHRAYHKFYLQLPLPKVLKPHFKSPEYVTYFSVFPVPGEQWGEAVKTEVKKLNKVYKKVPTFTQRKLNKVKLPEFGDLSHEDWRTNRRGIEALDPDFVLPPFEALQSSSQGVKVWFRDYLLGANGLLKQAKIGGQDFLARSQELNLVVNGQKVTFRPVSQKLVLNRKGRAVYDSRLTSSLLDLKVLTTIEYDGMVRVDLTLLPKQKITLEHFDYGFTLPRQHAKYIHYIGAPKVNNLSIMVPAESFTFSVPQQSGVFFAEPFKTLVWLGNNDRGFLWFSESEQHFSPQNIDQRPQALTAQVAGDNVEFKVTPVSADYQIAQPITYTFGFFATPVRPLPRDFRNWSLTTRQALYASEAAHGHIGTIPMIWPDEWRAFDSVPRVQPKDYDRVKGYVDSLHKQGRPALTYVDSIRIGLGYLRYLDTTMNTNQLNDLFLAKGDHTQDAFIYMIPEVKENFHDWKTQPELIYAYSCAKGGRELRVSSASSFADYLCFLMEKLALMGFDGLGDLDNCFPIRDQNIRHQAGYVDQHGQRHWTWDWFARRDLLKRIAATFLKTRGKPGIIIGHASATWSIPFLSFCDGNMVYEHSNSGYFSSPSFFSRYGKNNEKIYQDVRQHGGKKYLRWAFPRDRWQAELSGKQFGLPTVILPNLTKSYLVDKTFAHSEQAAREIVMQAGAHDCVFWPIWCNSRPIIEWTKIKEKFNISAPTVKFFPYWEPERSPVRSTDDEITTAVYQNGSRWLVLVSNWGDKAIQTSLQLAQIPAQAEICDAETGEKLSGRTGQNLPLKVAARDYRILSMNR